MTQLGQPRALLSKELGLQPSLPHPEPRDSQMYMSLPLEGAQEHTAQTLDRRTEREGMGRKGDFLDTP